MERQWVQRRGQASTHMQQKRGKTHSEIHDFHRIAIGLEITLTTLPETLIESELKRIQAFARLAMNAGKDDGPLNLIDQLVRAIYL